MNILHEILHFQILLFVVLDKMVKRGDPSLLYELIVAGELPSYLLSGVFRRKVIIFIHRTVSNILFLHHISCVELDRKERRGHVKPIHSFYVHYVDRTFG